VTEGRGRTGAKSETSRRVKGEGGTHRAGRVGLVDRKRRKAIKGQRNKEKTYKIILIKIDQRPDTRMKTDVMCCMDVTNADGEVFLSTVLFLPYL
jgi:hypothetical protein